MKRTPRRRDPGRIRRWPTGLLAAAAVLTGPAVPCASAITFSVNPTQIVLAGRTRSGLLTLRNESHETLRFQLSVFAWQQSPAGEIKLSPTEDIVFFPALLTLRANEARRVRIGSLAAAAQTERTYRIFVEELPPLDRNRAGGVRVLTKMGIPIFLRPTKEAASAELSGPEPRAGKFAFTLSNTGNVHFVPGHIAVRGVGVGGHSVFEQSLNAWYVLAGGRREFEFVPPGRACEQVKALVVEVELASAMLTERLETPTGACQP